MKRLVVLTTVGFLALPGWAGPNRSVILSGEPSPSVNLNTWLKENRAKPEEAIKITQLGATAHQSQHIVQIRDHEKPHVHKEHDLTAFVLQGSGTLTVGKEEFPVKAGDVISIPKGTPHHYQKGSRKPTIVYVVFSPPFDGKDTVPVE